MANFGQLLLTNKGIQEQYKAQAGGQLKFKRIAMGSGKYSGNIMALTKLVTENVSVDISKGYTQNNAYIVEGFFSNESLKTGFAWREIGLFVEDENGNEILYCYANAGDTYDYIPATTDERYSKYIRVATAIGNATDVSIIESENFIGVDVLTFNTTVEELQTDINQLWPSKEVSGDAIAINDSANQPFVGMNIYGKSEQVKTTGKNLFKITSESQTVNGVTLTINSDGSVTANGTATANIFFNLGVYSLEEGNYILSGCNNGSKSTYIIYTQKEDSSGYVDLTDGEKVFTISDTDQRKLLIAIYNGATVTNLQFYPMISIEGGEYEPYTGGVPSPSPDYSQEIDSIGDGGSVTVDVYGGNLFDGVLEQGTINNTTGQNNGSTSDIRTKNYIRVYPNRLLYIKRTICTSYVRARFYDKDFNYIGSGSNGIYELIKGSGENPMHKDVSECVFKITHNDVAYMRLSDNSNDLSTKYFVGLYDGTTEDEYKEPQTISTALPNGLPGIPVSSGGNYTDSNGQQWICDVIDCGKGVYIHRTNVIAFSELEWNYDDAYEVFLAYMDDIAPSTLNLLCTHYITSNIIGASSPDMTIYGRQVGSRGGIGVKNSNYTDAAKFKTAMSDAMLLYELAEPIETALTDEQIAAYKALHTNNPNTTILNDAGADMNVEYVTKAFEGIMNLAAKPQEISASDIKSGIIPIEFGGTGADNAPDALKNLGFEVTTEQVNEVVEASQWETLGAISSGELNFSGNANGSLGDAKGFAIPVDFSCLPYYTDFRYVIKAGSTFYGYEKSTASFGMQTRLEFRFHNADTFYVQFTTQTAEAKDAIKESNITLEEDIIVRTDFSNNIRYTIYESTDNIGGAITNISSITIWYYGQSVNAKANCSFTIELQGKRG